MFMKASTVWPVLATLFDGVKDPFLCEGDGRKVLDLRSYQWQNVRPSFCVQLSPEVRKLARRAGKAP